MSMAAASRTGTLRLDLHVHTVASPDSKLSVEDALSAVRARGLDGLAITDHNSVASVEVALRLLRDEGSRWTGRNGRPVVLVPGVEVSTREGHLLAYFVSRVPERDQSLERTIAEIHRMGGLAVLSHPFRRAHGAGRSLGRPLPPLDGIEGMNGHNHAQLNVRAQELAREAGLPMTGGSDAHRADEIGRCYTEFAGLVAPGRDELLTRSPRPGGTDLAYAGGVAVSLRNAAKRARRGLRPV